MSGGALVIDYDAIAETGWKLLSVKSDIEGVQGQTRGAADAVHHEVLAEVLRSFGTNWDTRQQEFITALETIIRMGDAIVEEVGNVDRELATAALDES